MKYLDWLWRLPFVWLIKIIATIFAPLIGLCIIHQERTDRVKRLGNKQVTMQRAYLIKPLYWFQTHDNAVDEYWWGCFNESSVLTYFRGATQDKYEASAFFRYACRVMWLWRNCAYGFSYNVFSKPLDETLSVIEQGDPKGKWSRFTQRKSSWQFKANYPIRDWFKLSVNIGWKEHKGFPKAMYADRLVGTDSLK